MKILIEHIINPNEVVQSGFKVAVKSAMLTTVLPILALVIACRGEMEGFIVGGFNTSILRFPHSAFLVVNCKFSDGSNTVWVCGASIVNQRILMTAAHCVHGCRPGSQITANVGDAHRKQGVARTASSFVEHEKYLPSNNECDIALVKLKKDLVFSDRISRVALLRNPPYDEPANIAGWGLINGAMNTQNDTLFDVLKEIKQVSGHNLKELDQKVWKRAACFHTFGYTMPRGTICASSKKRCNFASHGDSGSALVVRGYIQIGLVSFKTPSLALNVIVYTDIGYHYDWIQHNAHELYCAQC